MGKQFKKRGGGAQGPGPRGAAASEEKVEELLAEAEELLGNEQYAEGLALLQNACRLAPRNPQAAEALGLALAEFGGPAACEEAVQALRKAVELQPHLGHEKHMYLGQLVAGQEGIGHLRRGVELLQAESDRRPNDGEITEALSSGICALAEALLAEGAADADGPPPPHIADECRALLDRASRLAPGNPEPLQALAAMHAQQGQPDAALAALRRSVSLWLPAPGDGAAAAEMEWPTDPPGYEFRCETAKLLLDLDDSTTTAVAVLEGLLEEKDDVPEVWFLLALAHHGGCAFTKATMCLDQTQQLLAPRLGDAGGGDDDGAQGLAQEVARLREAVDASAAAWAADGHPADDEDDEEEEEAAEALDED